jgi:hypothetical protein
MDALTIVSAWVFTAMFAAWTALAITHIATGRVVFRLFVPNPAWSSHEIRLSAWGWVICGVAGMVWALLGGLIFGARVIPLFWVGSPWAILANPAPLIIIGNGFYQALIDQRHRGRWPFKRALGG